MSEFDFKQILQRNYQQLTQELEVDKVVRRLFTRDVLDEEDKEDIEAERSRHERAEKLLGMLLRRGEGNFKVFCEILGKLPSQQHLANILASHINSGCNNLPVGIQEQQINQEHQKQEWELHNSITSSLLCQPSRFIGRRYICDQIVSTIVKRVIWLIVLVAPPGFGKSTVGTTVGHMMLERGYSILYFSLRKVVSVASLASNILEGLGMPSSPGEDLRKKVMKCLREIKMNTVLMLDNAEDLQVGDKEMEFTTFVRDIGESVPNVCILITTRKAVRGLNMGNFLYESIPLKPLNVEESAELLQLLVPHISMVHARSLGSFCGGVPLFLNIAGSLLKNGANPEPLISELKNMPEKVLNGSHPDIKDYHDCLRIFIRRQSAELRSALTRLAVFPTTFTQTDVRFVFPDNTISEWEFQSLLARLITHSLVEVDCETRLYSLHPLVQAFCKGSKDDVELDTRYNVAETLFIGNYLELLRQLHLQFISRESKEAIKKYKENKVNIQHALRRTCELVGQQERGIDVSTEVVNFLAKVMTVDEFKSLYQSMADTARRLGDDRRYSDCLTSIGFREVCYSGRRGNTSDKARKILTDAHRIQSRLGGTDWEPSAHCLCKLGVCHVYAGDTEKGVRMIAQGICMRYRLKNKVCGPVERMVLAGGYSDLAVAFAHLGLHKVAVKIWRDKSLEIYREVLGDHPFTATLLEYIGSSLSQHKKLKQQQQAVMCMRQSLDMRRSLLGEEHSDTARAYCRLGRALSAVGNYRDALASIDHALGLFNKVHACDTEIELTRNERNDIEKMILFQTLKRRLENRELSISLRNEAMLRAPSL